RIAKLPDGAVVVNTARGTVVDDDALIAALKSGKLAAAGLDVFRGEPKLDPRYRDLPNTLLLPHMGSATVETRDAMGFKCLDNLDAFFAGKEPPDALNSRSGKAPSGNHSPSRGFRTRSVRRRIGLTARPEPRGASP